jgi:CheY-like chemotaxis protein
LGKRILVVDDDRALLRAVSEVLRHAGANVKSANGVVEGVALLAAKDAAFDAVLTDLRMPVTSGKSILGLMKTTYPDVPVLVMSAFWTKELKDECARLGADKFIDKPLTAPQLLMSVASALPGSH